MNTFDEIVAVYENTTPLRGKRAMCEIKPLGKRSRWWERIQKHSENCYVLSDGWSWGYNVAWYERSEEEKQKNMDTALTQAPVVWERRADGDYIRINKGSSQSNARYKFLCNYLPKGLRFGYYNGKHWVRYGEEKHYIPHMPWNHKEGGKYLEFKCLGEGKFERSNGKHLFLTDRVNKAKAKELKPHINKLWDWMQVIMPVLGRELHEHFSAARSRIYKGSLGLNSMSVWTYLTNEEHPHRLDFALYCVEHIDAVINEYHRIPVEGRPYPIERRESYFDGDDKYRAKFRRYIYRLMDAYDYEMR